MREHQNQFTIIHCSLQYEMYPHQIHFQFGTAFQFNYICTCITQRHVLHKEDCIVTSQAHPWCKNVSNSQNAQKQRKQKSHKNHLTIAKPQERLTKQRKKYQRFFTLRFTHQPSTNLAQSGCSWSLSLQLLFYVKYI